MSGGLIVSNWYSYQGIDLFHLILGKSEKKTHFD